jgi:uncharacterized protein YqeY
MTSEVSSLKTRITEDMKSAMRAQDKNLLGTIRLLLSAIKQREVDERVVLSDGDILDVISKMIKQRKDSVTQFIAANRTDLADVESQEILYLQAYLPEPLSEVELNKIIDDIVVKIGASGIKDMGKVMAELREKVHGRADMGVLGGMVKQRLNA